MALKKDILRKKLAFFKKHIEAKLKNLTNDLDDSRGMLESNLGVSASLAQDSVGMCIWPMLALTHMRERKDTIYKQKN